MLHGLRRARDARAAAERERAAGAERDDEDPAGALRDRLERVDQRRVAALQAEEPHVQLGCPALRECDGLAHVVGVREVDGPQAARPAGHDRLEELEALTERRRGEQVAARDRVALPRAHAEACQHALVVALEDALAVRRHADVLDGRRAGDDVEALLDAGPLRGSSHQIGARVVSDRSHDA